MGSNPTYSARVFFLMFRRPESPGLERYLYDLNFSLRVQKAKRFETVLKWGSMLVWGYLIGSRQIALGIVSLVIAMTVDYWLARRRLGATSHADLMNKTLQAHMPFTIQKLLRDGQLRTRIGDQATDLLESCSLIADRILTTCAVLNIVEPITDQEKLRLRKATRSTTRRPTRPL